MFGDLFSIRDLFRLFTVSEYLHKNYPLTLHEGLFSNTCDDLMVIGFGRTNHTARLCWLYHKWTYSQCHVRFYEI